MGHLNNRVEKLENGNGEPCDECGGGVRPEATSYEITWSAGDHDVNEYCGTCGETMVLVVRWPEDIEDNRP